MFRWDIWFWWGLVAFARPRPRQGPYHPRIPRIKSPPVGDIDPMVLGRTPRGEPRKGGGVSDYDPMVAGRDERLTRHGGGNPADRVARVTDACDGVLDGAGCKIRPSSPPDRFLSARNWDQHCGPDERHEPYHMRQPLGLWS